MAETFGEKIIDTIGSVSGAVLGFITGGLIIPELGIMPGVLGAKLGNAAAHWGHSRGKIPWVDYLPNIGNKRKAPPRVANPRLEITRGVYRRKKRFKRRYRK